MNDTTQILALLKKHRFRLDNEKLVQADIEKLLIDEKIPHRREYILSEASIIDFMVGNTGIEIKIGKSAKAIYRQCERYLQFDELAELILVTNKSIGLPAQINNKNTYILNLGKAWL